MACCCKRYRGRDGVLTACSMGGSASYMRECQQARSKALCCPSRGMQQAACCRREVDVAEERAAADITHKLLHIAVYSGRSEHLSSLLWRQPKLRGTIRQQMSCTRLQWSVYFTYPWQAISLQSGDDTPRGSHLCRGNSQP